MIKKALILGAGMSVSSLVQLVATPWLSRVYTPQEFGGLAVFTALASVAISVSSLRHDAAILVVEEEAVAATSQLALIYILCVSVVSYATLKSGLLSAINMSYAHIENVAAQLTLSILGGGALLVACALSMRKGEYISNALMRVIQGPAYILGALFLSVGLINSWMLGWLIIGLGAFFYIFKKIGVGQKDSIARQAGVLKDYIYRLTPTFLVDSLALSLPIFFISSAFGPSETGYYSQVSKLVGAPLLLASAVMGQIFIEESGRLYRAKKSSLKLYWSTIGILFILSWVAIAILAVAGEELARFFFGSGWNIKNGYIILVTIPILCKVMVSPVTTIFLTHHKIHFVIKWQILYFVTTLFVLMYSARHLEMSDFLVVYAISEIMLYFVYGVLAWHVGKLGWAEDGNEAI